MPFKKNNEDNESEKHQVYREKKHERNLLPAKLHARGCFIWIHIRKETKGEP